MKNGKTILYIVAIIIVLVLIVKLLRYRTCENNKQAIADFLDGKTPPDFKPTPQQIIEGSKECKFW
jgi:hypothetical protein